MQFKAHVAQEITDVVQALMLFFVAADMIVRWLLRMRAAEEGEKITLSTGWGSH
jgi:simple sugar transport system permease protein